VRGKNLPERKELHAYLLRMWQARVKDQWTWHFLLEHPNTREVLSFNCLDDLINYLTKIVNKNQAIQLTSNMEEK